MTTRILVLVCACFFAGSPVNAQPSPSPGLTVQLFSWQGDLIDVTLKLGAESITARADEFMLGSELVFKRSAPTLTISRADPAAGPGEARVIPLAEINLTASLSRVIILLAPAPAGAPLPFVAQVLDASPDAQPDETVRLLNFSSRTIAVKIGGEAMTLNPGEQTVSPYVITGVPGVFLQVAVKTEGGWQMIRSGLQPAPRQGRVLGFVRDGRIDRGNLDPNARAKPVDAFFFVIRAPQS